MSNLIFEADCQELTIEKDELIIESTGKKEKVYKIKGKFSTIGEKNRNGRTYPMHLWEAEVNRYQNEIANGTRNTLMEWEHPARSEVDPMKAVAKINKLWIDGKYVMGEAVLLNNDQANQLKSLIDNGVKISVSSRGVGTVGSEGIVEDFKLITYDIVPDPSDYNATMNGVCESYMLTEGILQGKSFRIENGAIISEEDINYDTIKNSVSNALINIFESYDIEDESEESDDNDTISDEESEETIDDEDTKESCKDESEDSDEDSDNDEW